MSATYQGLINQENYWEHFGIDQRGKIAINHELICEWIRNAKNMQIKNSKILMGESERALIADQL